MGSEGDGIAPTWGDATGAAQVFHGVDGLFFWGYWMGFALVLFMDWTWVGEFHLSPWLPGRVRSRGYLGTPGGRSGAGGLRVYFNRGGSDVGLLHHFSRPGGHRLPRVSRSVL